MEVLELLKRLEGAPERELSPGEVVLDEEFYPRSEIDSELVEDYASLMRDGTWFKPVTLCRLNGRLYVADGWHRVEAAKSARLAKIRARIVEASSRLEVYALACLLNSDHGKRLTPEERRGAARRLYEELRKRGVEDCKAVEVVAECLRIAKTTVYDYLRDLRRDLRREIEERARELRRQGRSVREIARELGISKSSVHRILTGRGSRRADLGERKRDRGLGGLARSWRLERRSGVEELEGEVEYWRGQCEELRKRISELEEKRRKLLATLEELKEDHERVMVLKSVRPQVVLRWRDKDPEVGELLDGIFALLLDAEVEEGRLLAEFDVLAERLCEYVRLARLGRQLEELEAKAIQAAYT